MVDYKEKYLKYKLKYQELKALKQQLQQKQQLGGTSKKNIILFKANWCGHCQNFMPKWEQLKNKYNSKYNFITYDSEAHKNIVNKYNVQGYPTIYVEHNNKQSEYKGSRTEQDILNFANKL
jgi:thiol-disulfide isomerase/thioredoxin